MRAPVRIPIRIKILIAVLFVITTVVSLITFTMAHLFHVDKKAYVSDLASVIALHAAEETKVLLTVYRERLFSVARIVDDPQLTEERKAKLVQELFSEMSGFVGIEFFQDGKLLGSVYDQKTLRLAGLRGEDLQRDLERHAPPFTSIVAGTPYVSNRTLSLQLPMLALAVASASSHGALPMVLVGHVRLDDLLALGRQSRSFEVFLVDGDGVMLSHGDRQRVSRRERPSWMPHLEAHSLAVVTEYRRDGRDMIGGFSPVGFAGVVAGAQVPKAAAYFASRQLLTRLILVALVLLLCATLASMIWSRQITRSIGTLVEATRVIGKGQFDVYVAAGSGDEMGLLAESFNNMAGELHARDESLKQAQAQLVHSEKMAAFGQLGAGIAHEVKNPLAGILGVVQLSLRQIGEGHPMHPTLVTIDKETRRCKSIIDNMLKFARQERVACESVDIARVLEDAAAIMRHQMSLRNVKLVAESEPGLPPVSGSANQLQQVLMNLMLNAQQAMEPQGGMVEIRARRMPDDSIQIAVRDTGPGVPKEIQARIFEPFFTTKPAGTGTGLGLSVSFGIIKDHKGDISVESEAGRGTLFLITLPAATATARPPRANTRDDDSPPDRMARAA